MTVSNKIKALLSASNKEHKELAQYLGISAQALSNKFYRDSFNAADLIKISEFTGAELAFIKDNTKEIILSSKIDNCINVKIKNTKKTINFFTQPFDFLPL